MVGLAFTSPSDDIIFQEGTSAYNFKAHGTILAGQLVYVNDTMEVAACDGRDKVAVVGVAAYDVTDGEYVAVWGKGNIVRCKSSGTVSVGKPVAATYNGHVYNFAIDTGVDGRISGLTVDRKVGMALETKATDTATRVLLT